MWFWLFIISTFINIFLLFYVRWLFKSLAAINQDIVTLVEKINEFSAHLKSIHEMEMFYGDQTLQALMTHASELSNEILDLDLLLNQEEESEFEKEKS
tara:strand:+ start:387 stop:680 length:294 start_codon:yes stop_codon:yes gene_type:complete